MWLLWNTCGWIDWRRGCQPSPTHCAHTTPLPQAKAYHIHPTGATGIEVEGGGWGLAHHQPSGDACLSLRRRLGAADLKLTQVVPGGAWFLVPSPCLEVRAGVWLADSCCESQGGGGGGGGTRALPAT